MVKRLISAQASDIAEFTKTDLLASIKASEGRVILSESLAHESGIVGDITAAEVDLAHGADMILLNHFDVRQPAIASLYQPYQTIVDKASIHELKRLVGLPIGINLEPVDPDKMLNGERVAIGVGRQANADNFALANQQGIDFICLTGNPGVGVSHDTIIEAIKIAKKHYDGVIIAGKMHGAGLDEPLVDLKVIQDYIAAGCDVLLLPAVGTTPGVREEQVARAIDFAHGAGVLVMTAIGTSQEASHPDVIRRIALTNKILGADIQHIGDANVGLVGVRNITVLSDTIRGARHTVSRIARSINR